jgi:thiol-disulfide isomerase/thioredoxin
MSGKKTLHGQEVNMARLLVIATALMLWTGIPNPPALFPADGAKELALQAEKRLDEGSRLAGADKLAEAAAEFLKAAELYEQALRMEPGNSSSRQNLVFSLGERAMIYIRKGQTAAKGKEYTLASDLYLQAIAAYDLALKRLPQEKNFQTNRRYCRNEWGTAQFQAKLANKGSAYAFQLTGLDGKPVKLAGMKGKVVVLEFIAGWCPSCRESLPVLQELQLQFKAKGVQIVVLALDRVDGWGKSGSEAKTLELAKGKAFTAAWADEETCHQYGSFHSIPTVILIDRQGKIAAQVPADDRDREQLARRIAALL